MLELEGRPLEDVNVEFVLPELVRLGQDLGVVPGLLEEPPLHYQGRFSRFLEISISKARFSRLGRYLNK